MSVDYEWKTNCMYIMRFIIHVKIRTLFLIIHLVAMILRIPERSSSNVRGRYIIVIMQRVREEMSGRRMVSTGNGRREGAGGAKETHVEGEG